MSVLLLGVAEGQPNVLFKDHGKEFMNQTSLNNEQKSPVERKNFDRSQKVEPPQIDTPK